MSKLIVYAGPNGGGKSTLRDRGQDAVDVVIDADRIARTLSPKNPTEVELEAGRRAIKLFRDVVGKGKSLSLESTLTGQTVFTRMITAKQAGYEVELYYIALRTVAEHIERVAHRVREGGHSIPPEIIARRYERSLNNLPEALWIADRALIIDNSGATIRDLLAVEKGYIVQRDPNPPAWLRGRMPAIVRALNRTKRD